MAFPLSRPIARRLLRGAALAGLAAAFLVAPRPAAADSLEHELKAAYIYNFIRFVEWPPSSNTGEIAVCVAGPKAVQREMRDELEGRKVGNRTITVRAVSTPAEAVDCEVLYVCGRDGDNARRFTAGVPRDRVLTITEAEDFPSTGGLINFFVDQQTIRFAVNADLLSETRFKLSSQMLQFGTMVSQKAGAQ